MTIKEIIGDFKAYEVQQRLTKLQAIKAPAIMLKKLTEQIADFKAGLFKVKGLARKHQVADLKVTATAIAYSEAYVFSTRDQSVNCKTQPTAVLKFETAKGTYYYDAATNQISSTLDELALKTVPKSFKIIPRLSK